MNLSTAERGHPPVLLDGEIDMATAERLTAALREPVAQGGPVIADLSQITFIDSTGLRTFYDAAQALEGRGCLILHGVNAATERVMSLIRLGDVPNIHIVGCHLLPRWTADGPGSWSRAAASRGLLFELGQRSRRNRDRSARLCGQAIDRSGQYRRDREVRAAQRAARLAARSPVAA